MKRFYEVLTIALAWLAFLAVGPRVLTDDWMGGLTLVGMLATFIVVSRHGLVRRKDPLSLSATGRRPYFEMR
jgi:hypothetical protein